MLPDRSIVDEVRARWQKYGGERLPPRDMKTEFAVLPSVPREFWRRRGLDLASDLRTFRPIETRPAEGIAPSTVSRVERILGSSDLMEVVFLEAALLSARTVGRIRVNGANSTLLGFGTGFMVSPSLMLTNHHVLKSEAQAGRSGVEFGFETRLGNSAPTDGKFFRFEPGRFYLDNPALDFALVAVAPQADDGTPLARFGFNKLVDDDENLIAERQFANIIQHPGGQPKQLAFRQNEVIGKPESFLHYRTDTAPGSSGAPVFNDQWQVVALHRAGVWATNDAGQILAVDGSVWREEMGEDRIRWLANEGVRIPRMIAFWRAQSLNTARTRLLDEIFSAEPPLRFDEEAAAASTRQPPPSQDDVRVTHRGSPRFAELTLTPDGVVRWSIPLGGERFAQGSSASAADGGSSVGAREPAPSAPDAAAPDLEVVLERARATLTANRNDVLGVRAGWVFDDEGMTDERALVVTVRRKRPPADLAEAGVTELPGTFMGYPIQVMDPTVEDLLRLSVGPAATEALTGAGISAEEILYEPPQGLDLDTLERKEMRVIAHVSPDAGWPVLSRFIADAREELVGAMYEFTAEHIRDALIETATQNGFRKLKLVLDSARGSARNDPDTIDSERMVRQMKERLDERLEVSWVKLGPVNGWVERSYHIKVLVRDRKALWLSSGNWKDSGQPDADPTGNAALLRTLLTSRNREWHVVIENADLAATFRTALLGDFEANLGTRPEELAGLPELFVSERVQLIGEERLEHLEHFPPFDETREFTVTPVLTPDNYLQAVVPAIRDARSSILVQNQTLDTPRKTPDPRFRSFWKALLAAQRNGLDVRLILRLQERDIAGVREDVENLRAFGFRKNSIRIQPGCHTKGIVIDGERVLVGSHNLSQMGATTNRDASLLFDDAPLAQYFARIFRHDWNQLAEVPSARHWRRTEFFDPQELAADRAARFDWKEWLETR